MSHKAISLALVAGFAVLPYASVTAEQVIDGGVEQQFEQRLKGFCAEWSHEIKNMTMESTAVVCQCLYDAAVDKTSDEVKITVVALPNTAIATDFDKVYAESSMDRAVVDEITDSAWQCLGDHGVPAGDE
jgi:hypothetical protein